MEPIFTIKEIAEALGRSTKTIYNYVESGELKAVKVGRQWRVAPDELERFLKEGVSKKYMDFIDRAKIARGEKTKTA